MFVRILLHPRTMKTIFDFTPDDDAAVLQSAREQVASAIRGNPAPRGLPPELADAPITGLFVTLKNRDKLRSCIGYWNGESAGPLGPALARAAVGAATDDPRFPPIPLKEVPALTVEVSLLSNPRTVEATGEGRIGEVAVGRHGLILEDGRHRGLLLPQVATEHGWGARTFLEHTALKAGLPRSAWLDPKTTLTTFEARILVNPPE